MAISRIVGGAVGAAGGVVAGAAGGAVVGAATGALKTVSLQTRKTEKVEVDGKEVDAKVKKIPGLVETLAAGALCAVGVAMFGGHPETWPIIGFLAAKLGATGAAAGFLTGVSFQAIGNTVLSGIGGGIGGAGLGGVGGATLGANLVENVTPKAQAQRKAMRAEWVQNLEQRAAKWDSMDPEYAQKLRALRDEAMGK